MAKRSAQTTPAARRPHTKLTNPGVVRTVRYALLLLILLAALLLRVYRLAEVPIGVDYDEAGNFAYDEFIWDFY